MPNNPRRFSPNPAPAPRSALRQRSPGMWAYLARLLVLVLFGFPLQQ